jgi:hypothetical protein
VGPTFYFNFSLGKEMRPEFSRAGSDWILGGGFSAAVWCFFFGKMQLLLFFLANDLTLLI